MKAADQPGPHGEYALHTMTTVVLGEHERWLIDRAARLVPLALRPLPKTWQQLSAQQRDAYRQALPPGAILVADRDRRVSALRVLTSPGAPGAEHGKPLAPDTLTGARDVLTRIIEVATHLSDPGWWLTRGEPLPPTTRTVQAPPDEDHALPRHDLRTDRGHAEALAREAERHRDLATQALEVIDQALALALADGPPGCGSTGGPPQPHR